MLGGVFAKFSGDSAPCRIFVKIKDASTKVVNFYSAAIFYFAISWRVFNCISNYALVGDFDLGEWSRRRWKSIEDAHRTIDGIRNPFSSHSLILHLQRQKQRRHLHSPMLQFLFCRFDFADSRIGRRFRDFRSDVLKLWDASRAWWVWCNEMHVTWSRMWFFFLSTN